MSLTRQLYHNSVFFLALIPLFAIWGFWVTYLIRPAETLTGWDHLHGAAMLGWCLLLIAQAFLIRTKHGSIHRRLGRLFFVWAPLVVISTLVLAHYRLNTRGLTPDGLYLLAIQLFLLAQFVICYGFAIAGSATGTPVSWCARLCPCWTRSSPASSASISSRWNSPAA
jgi:hypothetical protein